MKEPKQVLVINDYGFVNGGISQVALDSARGLAAKGLDVTFFSAVAGHEGASLPGVRMESTGQREIMADPNKLKGLTRAYWNRSAEKAVERLANSLDPERSIVHVHSWTQANSASIFAPLLRKKIRSVVTLHDYFIACPTGAFMEFPRALTCRARPLSFDCLKTNCDARSRLHKFFKFGRQWVQAKAAKTPSGIRNFIFVSPFSRDILREFLPDQARYFLLANPIDLPKQAPADSAQNTAWTFVGRLSREKGARIFAEAAARLKLDAVFLGEGEEAEAIRGIYPAAQMHGWVEREEVLRTLTRSRGLVFPSLALESSPLAVTEAMALGLPLIVASDTAASEIVGDGEVGLIFRKNDPIDLADKIRQLEENPELRIRMGRRAFERYWSKPATLDKHVEELLNIYQQAG